MRVLLIKTSSLGDVVHTLGAVTDALRARPHMRFDWVVEEAFAEIPAWHPGVDRVIPLALRRWRKRPLQAGGEWRAFMRDLRGQSYDCVLDAQGLIKSAVITRLARGPRTGLDGRSAREPLAALAYQRKIAVPKGEHAVARLRTLFARALDYDLPHDALDYGIDPARLPKVSVPHDSLVFLHGTTWTTKHWPEAYWRELAALVAGQGRRIVLPWGNDEERARARRIAEGLAEVQVLPRLSLAELAAVISAAQGVIGVDTGLAHLAAALRVPTVTMYGATDPGLTGTYGEGQTHLRAQFQCAPCLRRECLYSGVSKQHPACYEALTPLRAWEAMNALWQAQSSRAREA